MKQGGLMRISPPFVFDERPAGVPLCMVMKSLPLLLISTLVIPAAALRAESKDDAADPAKVDADYAIQGEYTGTIGETTVGIQVVALGDGKFDAVSYIGGLPGAGWNGDKSQIVKSTGTADAMVSGDHSGSIKNGVITVKHGDEVLGTLKRIVRESPTIGAKAPAGAVVLFDGKNADAWEGGRMTADGLLIQGATSKEKFQSYTAHCEFRTPYKPKARGQERGNSGFYAQGRYETQVLDSFGLEGKNNETGGIYSVKDPLINMCLPPLQWQTYDVDFTAAQFDAAGKKTKNARMTVKLNGVVVQNDTEIDHATTAAPVPEGPTPGPIYIQDHGNPVRYRNVWISPK